MYAVGTPAHGWVRAIGSGYAKDLSEVQSHGFAINSFILN